MAAGAAARPEARSIAHMVAELGDVTPRSSSSYTPLHPQEDGRTRWRLAARWGGGLLGAVLVAEVVRKWLPAQAAAVRRGQGSQIELLGLEPTCAKYGCTDLFMPAHVCQCNSACTHHGSCCSDYSGTCSKDETMLAWEVTFKGNLSVWSKPNSSSAVISRKAQCSIVQGKRHGDWVALEGEPGYVLTSYRGMELLRETVASYAQVPNGMCEGAGASPIRGEAACRAAVSALGLSDGAAIAVEHSLPGQPAGCVLTGAAKFLRQPSGGRGGVLCYSRDQGCGPEAVALDALARRKSVVLTASKVKAAATTTADTTPAQTTLALFTTTSHSGPRLFCLEVMRTQGYEPSLVKAQAMRRMSIFACDDYMLFSSGGGVVDVSPATAQNIDVSQIVTGTYGINGMTTDSWLNTPIFMKAWDLVVQDGRYLKHDWAVKVDPDAVFFPDRLRSHMAPHDGARDALYVANCDKVFSATDEFKDKLFGAIEVFSRKAIEEYARGSELCQDELKWKGWGEDFYMQACLNKLGVKKLNDPTVLSDNRCIATACTDTSKVAFHFYKDVPGWNQCWEASLGPAGVKAFEESRGLTGTAG